MKGNGDGKMVRYDDWKLATPPDYAEDDSTHDFEDALDEEPVGDEPDSTLSESFVEEQYELETDFDCSDDDAECGEGTDELLPF